MFDIYFKVIINSFFNFTVVILILIKRKSSWDGYFIGNKSFLASYWIFHDLFLKKILIRST